MNILHSIAAFFVAIFVFVFPPAVAPAPLPAPTEAIVVIATSTPDNAVRVSVPKSNKPVAISKPKPIITDVPIVAPAHAVIPQAPTESAPKIIYIYNQAPALAPSEQQIGTMVVENKAAITAEIVRIVPADPVNDVPHGTYLVQVSVLDADGKTIKDAPISIAAPDYTESRTTNTRATRESVDYYTTFDYSPKTTGPKTLVFTSGNLTKELDITVE